MTSIDVTLYTRKQCALCDEAKSAIGEAASRYGIRIAMREVDIDRDPALRERFTSDVPVIYVNGSEAFRHRVQPEEFARFVRNVATGFSPSHNGLKPVATSLSDEKCVPCRGGVPPLKGEELSSLAQQLGSEWRVVNEHHLEKEFTFPDFAQALAFTNRIGAIAEQEGHHPDIYLAWGKVRVTIWTHKIDGLTRSDFVLAAKIERATPAPDREARA